MEKFYGLINRDCPTLVEFYSSKAAHEDKLNAMLDKLKAEKDFLKVLRYDVDDPANSKLIEKYEIKELPSFLLFHEGELVWRDFGELSLNKLKGKVDEFRLHSGSTHPGSHQKRHSGRREDETHTDSHRTIQTETNKHISKNKSHPEH